MYRLEHLESRTLFAGYEAATVAELIAAMNQSNGSAEEDTIVLAAGATFLLTAVDNTTHGPTGMPVVVPGGGALTIAGSGATIERAHDGGIFFGLRLRLFDVAAGALLTLNDLVLQGGLAGGAVVGDLEARGGAVHNLGTLTLEAVTIQNNAARAFDGSNVAGRFFPAQAAAGGGIYSAGTLNMTGCVVQNNHAQGGWGDDAFALIDGGLGASPGADGAGGGVYIAGGSATINGSGGTGGLHYSQSLKPDKKPFASSGRGIGGGIYIILRSDVALDAFSTQHTMGNTSTATDPDIRGPYAKLV